MSGSAFSERITNVEELRSWRDRIPLRYEYTAGVAGERFLTGLQVGKLVAARCTKCGRTYLPPKTYCVNCFVPMTNFSEVGPVGTISALTESSVDFGGRRIARPRVLAFVTFDGVTGGLIQVVRGRGLEIGSRVRAQFRPAKMRKGSIQDIEAFVPARVRR